MLVAVGLSGDIDGDVVGRADDQIHFAVAGMPDITALPAATAFYGYRRQIVGRLGANPICPTTPDVDPFPHSTHHPNCRVTPKQTSGVALHTVAIAHAVQSV